MWSVSFRAGLLRRWVHPSPSWILAARAAHVRAPSPRACSSSCLPPASFLVSVLLTERGGSFQVRESPPAQRSSATPAHFPATNNLRALPWSVQEWFRYAGSFADHTCSRNG